MSNEYSLTINSTKTKHTFPGSNPDLEDKIYLLGLEDKTSKIFDEKGIGTLTNSCYWFDQAENKFKGLIPYYDGKQVWDLCTLEIQHIQGKVVQIDLNSKELSHVNCSPSSDDQGELISLNEESTKVIESFIDEVRSKFPDKRKVFLLKNRQETNKMVISDEKSCGGSQKFPISNEMYIGNSEGEVFKYNPLNEQNIKMPYLLTGPNETISFLRNGRDFLFTYKGLLDMEILKDCKTRSSNCKSNKLNLTKNAQTVLKGMLFAADMGDGDFDVENIIIEGLKNPVIQRLVTDSGFNTLVKDALKSDSTFTTSVKGDTGSAGKDASPDAVANVLKANSDFRTLVKGDPGQAGINGQNGKDGAIGTAGKDGADGQNGKDGTSPTPGDVANVLVNNKATELGSAVLTADTKNVISTQVAESLRVNPGETKGPKGEPGTAGINGQNGKDGATGPAGKDGAPGKDGIDADPSAVAAKLVTEKKVELGKAVLDAKDTDGKVLSNQVSKTLKSDSDFRTSVKGEQGPAGPQGEMGPIKLTIVKGENHSEISGAKVVNKKGEDVATFSEIGYFFQDDELYIRNNIINANIRIPQEFNFLRIVIDSRGECKFALCNSLGNLLSEYKKYDPEYAQLPKFVEIGHIHPNALNKYHHNHTWKQLFHLEKGPDGVDVREINTGKKIGQLIDEFIYYKNDQLHYKNYHHPVEKECCYSENLYVDVGNNLSIKRLLTQGDSDNDPVISLEQSFDCLWGF